MVGSEVLMAVCCHNPCVGVFNGGRANGQTDGMTSNFMPVVGRGIGWPWPRQFHLKLMLDLVFGQMHRREDVVAGYFSDDEGAADPLPRERLMTSRNHVVRPLSCANLDAPDDNPTTYPGLL